MTKNSKRLIIWALIFAAVPRFVLWVTVLAHPDRVTVHDAPDYINPSVNWLAGNGFSQQLEEPFTPDTRRTPAYPALLILGMSISSTQWIAIVTLIQILINLATILILYRLALKFVDEKQAFWAACLLGFSLGHICYSVLIMSDILFGFTILLTIYGLYEYRDKPSWKMAVMIGLFLGLSTLTRPVSAPLHLILLPFIVLAVPRQWKAGLVHALLMLIVSVSVLTPWLLRNEQILGYKTVSTVPMRNMYVYNASMVTAYKEGRPPIEVQEEYSEEVVREVAKMQDPSQGALFELYDKKGKELIFDNFGLYTLLHLKSSMVSFFPNVNDLLELTGVVQGSRGTLSVVQEEGIMAGIQYYFGGDYWLKFLILPFVILLALTYLLALFGIWSLLKKGRWSFLLLGGLVFYFLVVSGPVAVPRFRIPVQPLICMLAVMGWPLFKKVVLRRS